ncbi:hypothetical protein [Dongshaea marina]|uniref:hypothetical protein n=1 Tax=Dongshaea marina TaxID=2047966 RepID=UPI00131F2913|nr:hypothetical protein [Dongshaea marina]
MFKKASLLTVLLMASSCYAASGTKAVLSIPDSYKADITISNSLSYPITIQLNDELLGIGSHSSLYRREDISSAHDKTPIFSFISRALTQGGGMDYRKVSVYQNVKMGNIKGMYCKNKNYLSFGDKTISVEYPYNMMSCTASKNTRVILAGDAGDLSISVIIK